MLNFPYTFNFSIFSINLISFLFSLYNPRLSHVKSMAFAIYIYRTTYLSIRVASMCEEIVQHFSPLRKLLIISQLSTHFVCNEIFVSLNTLLCFQNAYFPIPLYINYANLMLMNRWKTWK